jgi:hypothetical protein
MRHRHTAPRDCGSVASGGGPARAGATQRSRSALVRTRIGMFAINRLEVSAKRAHTRISNFGSYQFKNHQRRIRDNICI